MSADQSRKDWRKHDGFAKLQTHARVPPGCRSTRAEASYVPGRGRRRASLCTWRRARRRSCGRTQRTVSSTAAGSAPAPYNLRTDSMREYRRRRT